MLYVRKCGWQDRINSVVTLDLSFSNVRDSHIRKLSCLPAITNLCLDSCPIGDSALQHLVRENVTPNLLRLNLSDTNVSDAGLAHVARLEKLTHLSLFYCRVGEHGLKQISELKELEVLNLDSRDISDCALRHLKMLPKLKSLDVFSGSITDKGCAHVARIPTLESISFCSGGISNTGCFILANMPNLKHVNLSQNYSISNQGAAALAATLTDLESMNLSNTSVDAGVLRLLTGLPKLHTLAMYGCQGMVNSARVEWFKSNMPSLKVLRIDSVSKNEGTMYPNSSSFLDDASMDDNSASP